MSVHRRVIAVVSLSAALYIAITCPCEVYLSCHRNEMIGLLTVATGLTLGL